MRITRLRIHNFRSLRNIDLSFSGTSVIVGPNASGKSNFADALAFIADVFNVGVEYAVANQGGYDNIIFRRKIRSSAAIRFTIQMSLSKRELMQFVGTSDDELSDSIRNGIFEHSFSLASEGTSLESGYHIKEESFSLKYYSKIRSPFSFSFSRTASTTITSIDKSASTFFRYIENEERFDSLLTHALKDSSELAFGILGRLTPVFGQIRRNLGSIAVYRLTPESTRGEGIPSRTAVLGLKGENLPAAVRALEKSDSEGFERVLNYMRQILPSLKNVTVKPTPSRKWGLFFEEDGIGRAWSVNEVSDGTIQALALFLAIESHDGHGLLIIEEPENSIHPWVLREVLDACRSIAKTRQIMLTSHSPILIDMLKPSEIIIASRINGETQLVKATDIDEALDGLWARGEVSLAEYFDSGAMPEAVPHSEV